MPTAPRLIAGLAAFVVVAVLGGCAPTPSAGPTASPTRAAADPGIDDETRAALDATVQEAFEATDLVGMAASVWVGGDRWNSVLGVADLDSQEPYELDFRARIASVTKTFTATAVLQLVDAGEFALDDTLESFVPGIPNGDRITIEDLLGMTSGIFDYTSDQDFLAAFAADPAMPFSPQDAIDIVLRHEPDFEPDAQTVYCDTNYVLLGMIIEQVTRRPVHEVINDEVVAAIGMPDTSFPAPDDKGVSEPHATSYTPTSDAPDAELVVVGDLTPAISFTAGAMASTVDDLRQWADELVSGSLLSPELQARRLEVKPIVEGRITISYGLGVMTIGPFVGHNGAILGNSTFVMRDADADVTVVISGNTATNFSSEATDIGLGLIHVLYPDLF